MLDFRQLVDLKELQRLLEAHHRLTGVLSAVLDTEENILVAVGWQDMCTHFHRIHPETAARCRHSDAQIKIRLGTSPEQYVDYRCQNGLQDVAMPIIIDGRHVATFFTGQFFYEDAPPDIGFFKAQAARFGFDEAEYLAALKKVPVVSRKYIRDIMDYYGCLVRMIAEVGLKNLKLAQEVAERQKSEKEASFFRHLVENTRDPVYVLDPADGYRMYYVNDAACEHFGLQREALLKMRIPDWDPGFDMSRIPDLDREIRRGKFIRFRTVHQVASGKLVPVEVTGSHLRMDGRELVAGHFYDMTEQVQLAEALREKDLLLLQQSRMAAMGEMIDYIAHQWRQPLHIIGLLVQNLELDQEQDRAGTIERVLDLVEHMSATIDDFRGFFRSDKVAEAFDMEEATRKIVNFVAADLSAHNIELLFEAGEDLIVVGHANEYSHVLLNILNNAKEELLERGVETPKIHIRLFREGDRKVITVRDNAGGIREDVRERLFDPHFTTKKTGTGIGLYISKVIIEKRFSGTLTAHNVNGGAEFRIEI